MTKQLEQQAREFYEASFKTIADKIGFDDSVPKLLAAFAASAADRAVERIKVSVEEKRLTLSKWSGPLEEGYNNAIDDILAEIAKEQK